MELLKERIRKEGHVKPGNILKVDSFLNHQMDISLFNDIGKEFKRIFADEGVNKILTLSAFLMISAKSSNVYSRTRASTKY